MTGGEPVGPNVRPVNRTIRRLHSPLRGIPHEREKRLRVTHRGECHGEFRADLVVAGVVLVEFKACKQLVAAHEAQLLNYLRASGLEVGLLLNFGPRPEMRRFVWSARQRMVAMDERESGDR